MTRGKLIVYLGAAPGVGKSYKALDEARRRLRRGTDVVVGYLETYGRPVTAQMAEGLEVVPPEIHEHEGRAVAEMDVDAILRREAQVVVVDELAHRNMPGARNAKRWQDIQELLDAGMVVITTINIQSLESLKGVVESITGISEPNTVPDEIVRSADQLELVDMSPEALRRRFAHGNVFASEHIDASLASYFRIGNLTALRELALLWVADRVDEGLTKYRAEHHIEDAWAARERVVVAITGGEQGEIVIRRAARLASRGTGGELMAVHVTRSKGPSAHTPAGLAKQRQLVEDLGGTFHQIVGDEVAMALLEFVHGVNATQLVLGSSTDRRWRSPVRVRAGIAETITPLSGDVDIHIVTHSSGAGKGELPHLRRSVSRRRLIASWVLTLVGLPLLTLILHETRETHQLPIEVLLFLTMAVGVALLGGIIPALVAAIGGALLLNFFFTEPRYTFWIEDLELAIAVVIFPLVAGTVASVVDLAARRTSEAARSRAEADTLATLASSVLRGDHALEALLDRIREAFGMRSVSVLERGPGDARWRRVASNGLEPAEGLAEADVEVALRHGLVLALRGRVLAANERRVLEAFAAHAGAVLERRRLADEAKEARRLVEANRIRTTLLSAVSHDLRAPVARIKDAICELKDADPTLTESERIAGLDGVVGACELLDRLVANLLDMSRVEAESVRPDPCNVKVAEIVNSSVGPTQLESLRIELPADLPAIRVDPELVERAVANIVDNAVRHNPAGKPVRVCASALGDRVELRVVDHGPGVPEDAKERIFEPFERVDPTHGVGVGLGLAVAKGFVAAVGGSLQAEDTPGGGLTMVLSLPAAPAEPVDEPTPDNE